MSSGIPSKAIMAILCFYCWTTVLRTLPTPSNLHKSNDVCSSDTWNNDFILPLLQMCPVNPLISHYFELQTLAYQSYLATALLPLHSSIPRQVSPLSQSPKTANRKRNDNLHAGVAIQKYQLVERTAILGMCDHQMFPHVQQAEMSLTKYRPYRESVCADNNTWEAFQLRLRGLCSSEWYSKGSKCLTLMPNENDVPQSAPIQSDSTSRFNLPVQDGPQLEYQCQIEDIHLIYINENYRLRRKFDAGSHGEVWRATNRTDGMEHTYILKRLFLEAGDGMVRMGLREAYYGNLLRGEPYIARFVEHFFRFPASEALNMDDTIDSRADNFNIKLYSDRLDNEKKPPLQSKELWLVFQDEGISLRHYLYSKIPTTSSVMYEPSSLWKRLRQDVEGEAVLKEIMLQLLKGIAILHAKGITHRDLKPSNILISLSKHKAPNNRSSKMEESMVVRLADFGSAVDAYTFHEFYEGNPTQAEETREYQPPEVLFNELGIVYDYENPTSYDLWSTGIIFLELILGSPQVFLISARDRVKLDVKLRGKDEQTKLKSYLLHVITDEFCIFQPEYNQLQHFWNKYALVTRGCHFGQFNTTILKRDPFHKGFQDPWGLDLIWKLLQWDPKQRISAKEALRHAFFVGPYICNETGRAFATKKELSVHLSYLERERKRQREFAHLVRDRVEIPAKFKCPKCARNFSTNLACQAHALARKHARNHAFCSFDDRVLNDAIRNDTKAAVPSPPDVHIPVGYAVFQGKRAYMEDLLVVERNATLGYTMYAIMDGHLGTATARFVKEHIFLLLCERLSRAYNIGNEAVLETLIRQTFLELQSAYLGSRANYESDFSGCTLTIALIDDLQQEVICGNVGDSRAVLYHIGSEPYLTELSHDHVPNDAEERRRIESNGGFVSFAGLWRVVGQLAVSRSIGDHHLRKYVSADPHVRIFDLTKDRSRRILVLASDGLWEVMSNRDVQAYLEGCMQNVEHSTQELSEIALSLVAEAYTRGSLDNIAIILVWLEG